MCDDWVKDLQTHRSTARNLKMSKAQTDIRTTSYDAGTANAFGYQGTIEAALWQIAADPDVPAQNKGRAELLRFLGVDKPLSQLSGIQQPGNPFSRDGYFEHEVIIGRPSIEDDSVEYGAPILNASPYSLEYAQQRWPENFQ
jgi:hypothetical protein